MKGIFPVVIFIVLMVIAMGIFMFPAILYPPEKTINTDDLYCEWWRSDATLTITGNTAVICIPEGSVFISEWSRAVGSGSCWKRRYVSGTIPSDWEDVRLTDSNLKLYTLDGFEKYYGEEDYNENRLMILRDGYGFAMPLNPADNTRYDTMLLGKDVYLEGCVTLENIVVTTTTTTIPQPEQPDIIGGLTEFIESIMDSIQEFLRDVLLK